MGEIISAYERQVDAAASRGHIADELRGPIMEKLSKFAKGYPYLLES
jgi:hypothetical protein